MSTPKFTAADVVVGARVHIRSTSTYGPRTTVDTFEGEVVALDNGEAQVKGADGVTSWADLMNAEILGVVPPKPEYVVGGIYRVKKPKDIETLRMRTGDGWSQEGRFDLGEKTFWYDSGTNDWTIGDRVLVTDYPSDETASNVLDHPESWIKGFAPDLVARALRAEADRGVQS